MTPERTAVVCAYHDVGVRCLTELLHSGAKVLTLFTHADIPEENLWFKSVAELAGREGIPCKTTDINSPENEALVRTLAPDFLFSFYYRSLIRREILDLPRLGALNLHGSYLPAYRGRVPVNWAVIQGETETGATLHYMVEAPDAGDIVDREKVSIAFTDTAWDVFRKVTGAAGRIVARAYPLLCDGRAGRRPMDLRAGSYFGRRQPADGLISWRRSAVELYNLIRGVTHPYPGAFTFLSRRKVLIWSAWPREGAASPGEIVSARPLLVGTGQGLLEIRSFQFDGEPESSSSEAALKGLIEGMSFSSLAPLRIRGNL